MPLTFSEFRDIVAPFAGRAGKASTSDDVRRFARQVMEYLLLSGSEAGVRRISLQAFQGQLTLPPEVEVPLKVRIDNRVGEVWNKWFSFHTGTTGFDSCYPARDVLIDEGIKTPLIRDLPPGGSIVGVMSTAEESDDAFVLIQGRDSANREIYMPHKGEQLPGEHFTLKRDIVHYGKAPFCEITAVHKSVTNGYIILYAVDPRTRQTIYLADWAPSEEKPLYRRMRLNARECGAVADISMLCRVRLKDNYHDKEVTLFENSLAVLFAAQRLNAEINDKLQEAAFKKGAVEDILDKEAGYKKPTGGPVSVFHPLSGGAIKNIV